MWHSQTKTLNITKLLWQWGPSRACVKLVRDIYEHTHLRLPIGIDTDDILNFDFDLTKKLQESSNQRCIQTKLFPK